MAGRVKRTTTLYGDVTVSPTDYESWRNHATTLDGEERREYLAFIWGELLQLLRVSRLMYILVDPNEIYKACWLPGEDRWNQNVVSLCYNLDWFQRIHLDGKKDNLKHLPFPIDEGEHE